MKKLSVAILILTLSSALQAQQTNQDSLRIANATSALPPKKPKVTGRPNDHIVLQFGVSNLGSVPDSMKTSGFSRFFNMYIMFDKPFKNNRHYSFAIGGGIGTDNYFFKDKYIDIKSNSAMLPFRNTAGANHFRKFKLTTMYLDIPLELRYVSSPDNSDKSFKAAIGAKLGFLLKAYTKGKDLQDANGNSIYDSKYIVKEYSRRYFSGTRMAVTGRIGYGHFSLSGSWQINNFLKEGAGPEVRPYNIGLTVSGL